MGHHTYNIATLKYDEERKLFYKSVVGRWKNQQEEIYREYEDGKCYSRYIYYAKIAGYLVIFPNEKLPYYYGGEKQQEQEFYECKMLNLFCSEEHLNYDLILEKEPTFNYLLKKFSKGGMSYLLKIINQYRTNKEIEFLVELNQFELASNKRLSKLSKERKRKVIEFVKSNPERFNMKLKIVEIAIKNNCSYEDAQLISFLHDPKLIKVFRSDAEEYYELSRFMEDYKSYKQSCIFVGHDFSDDYWKYPSNFRSQYRKVRDEERLKRDYEKQEQVSRKNKAYCEIIKTLSKEEKVKGYLVYVPTNVEDIIEQANTLNQCLITADYVQKVIDKKSILVFIKKESERIGTFEIDYTKKILQAYTNENDEDCHFSQELNVVANTFLQNYQLC